MTAMPAGWPAWTRSLRWRLLAATLVALLVALALAGLLLTGLFREHVLRQFEATLVAQLDQVTASLVFDDPARPALDPTLLSDPRWQRPYAGLYWQVDAIDGARPARGVLRSRSLWDTVLAVEDDALIDGVVHVHRVAGPQGSDLLLVERAVRPEAAPDRAWRLLVAGDLAATQAAAADFGRVLAASLLGLGLLLGGAALLQVRVGLAPLRALQGALGDLHRGDHARLDGQFPAEVQPLVDDFNAVLDRHGEVVARARTQAGNLAHAIKTPLAVLTQAARPARAEVPAAAAETASLAPLVREQVAVIQRHVDWHLARSRAAATRGLPGARAPVAPVVEGLVRVLARVHAERGLVWRVDPIDARCVFAGEVQDLQEMLGNLMDNACRWARRSVHVSVFRDGAGDGSPARLAIVVEDDGPGIAPARRVEVLARGIRLDETVPGSGLGLAIVQDLAALYGGTLSLGADGDGRVDGGAGADDRARGGLQVRLWLPAAQE